MRWLIIQTAFLGDVVLTLPLIEKINKVDSSPQILFITRPEATTIIETAKGIQQVLSFDKRKSAKGISGWYRMLKTIHNFQPDITIVPHRSLRSVSLAALSRSKYRIGYDRAVPFPGLTHRIPYRYNAHETARLLDLLYPVTNELGVPTPPRIRLTDQDIEKVDSLTEQITKPMIAIAPGAVWETKKYPTHYYEKLASLLNEQSYSIITVGGSMDIEICEMVAKAGKGISFAGKLAPRESAAMIAKSVLLITNDSAPLHLAQGVDTPTIAIFGATVPSFGFAPIRSMDRIIEINNLDCRPCGIHGGTKCPKKHFKCMKDLHPENVYLMIMEQLLKMKNGFETH